MSTVYLAQDEVLDRPVAVKLLHREISEEADQLERFRREARAAARLSHPNLVSVIDAGEDGGRPYIVFEYVEGETLKRRIQQQGGLPVDEAVAYAIEIGRGLTAAHGRKLVHRDVKPQNVLIDPDGRAKVTDFGIARSLESKGLTATGRVLGTTDYVSPEQAMGEDVDERSDVYSLGVVLYEMLDRRRALPGRDSGRRGDEARQRAAARRPERAGPRSQRRSRPWSTGPPPRTRATATARSAEMVRDLERHWRSRRPGGAAPPARRPPCSTRSRASRRRLARTARSRAGIAMGMVGIGPDRRRAGASAGTGSGDIGDDAGGGGTEIKLAPDAATDFDPFGGDGRAPRGRPAGRRRQPDRDGVEHRELRRRPRRSRASGSTWTPASRSR